MNNTAKSHSESLGYSFESLYRKGYSWILLSWNIRIGQLPMLGEKIHIETWISEIKRCFAYREFLIRNNRNEIIVFISSQWIFFNINKRKPTKIISEFPELWIIHPTKACNKSITSFSVPKEPDYQNTENIIIQQKDIDILNHVHNSKYIDWVMTIKPEKIWQKYLLKHLQAFYYHELKYPGEILIKQTIISPKESCEQFIYDKILDRNEHRVSAKIATNWEYAGY